MDINKNIFPRQLTTVEMMLLFSILPENKTGYNNYRNKIKELVITGFGRFDGGNLILGKENTIPDLSFPSSPVFAIGTNIYKEGTIDITIHEEVDSEIEFDISAMNLESIPETLTVVRKWNYSDWNPGDKAPGDNSDVREIKIIEGKYILAIVPVHKKIWIHEKASGVNYLIPVSNFYNELMRVCGIRDSRQALNPSGFFGNQENFSNIELKLAFLSYNKYLKRINIKEPIPIDDPQVKKNKNIFSIFRKGIN
ncbi:MAG TPA: hypothetical protein VLN45_09180 [Ignavibacteriaceae bacterium]|nr:hypothetical protein [Ignavibacteriaceae bacterium]